MGGTYSTHEANEKRVQNLVQKTSEDNICVQEAESDIASRKRNAK
jgi:hypothetical protein